MSKQPKAEKLAQYEKAEFGFWLYLMSDVIVFASLFATFMILRGNIDGGPSASDLLNPSLALIQTLILLTSSFTCGVAALALRFKRLRLFIVNLSFTILLGSIFLAIEVGEFATIIQEGYDWGTSGFLSSFFTLVATHGIHIAIGLLWGVTIGLHIIRRGINADTTRKFTLFALFWHFLDLVWIFIFAIVYLGAGL